MDRDRGDAFEQLSPLMEDCLRNAEIARAQLLAMAGGGSTQQACIAASGEITQLTFDYLERVLRITCALATSLRRVQ